MRTMRGKTLRWALCLTFLPSGAFAARLPMALIEAQLRELGLGRLALPEPPAQPIAAAFAPAASAPLFADAMWDKLAAPDAATLASLAKRAPNLDTQSVRTLTWEALEPLLAQAVARKMTVLDFFTDEGLRRSRIYYLPQALLTTLDKAYDLNSVFLISGKTVGGDPFQMTDVVIGGGRAVMLYDRDDFTFEHPVYKNHGGRYTVASVVTETINGPGDVGVAGLTGWLGISVRGIVKTSAGDIKIVTAVTTVDSYLYPIVKR